MFMCCLQNYLANEANREKFQNYINHKFGFGMPGWTAPYWFVGLEERGAETCGDIVNRIENWRVIGREAGPNLIDVEAYCERIGEHRWHQPGNSTQSTWKSLIKLVLNYEGTEVTQENVLQLQQGRLGRAVGKSVSLIEFSPLPARNGLDWPYSRCVPQPLRGVHNLDSRPAFLASIEEARCFHLGEQIRVHQPKWVVFYGSRQYLTYYRGILRAAEQLPHANFAEMPGFRSFRGQHTSYLNVASPSQRAWLDERLAAMANWLQGE